MSKVRAFVASGGKVEHLPAADFNFDRHRALQAELKAQNGSLVFDAQGLVVQTTLADRRFGMMQRAIGQWGVGCDLLLARDRTGRLLATASVGHSRGSGAWTLLSVGSVGDRGTPGAGTALTAAAADLNPSGDFTLHVNPASTGWGFSSTEYYQGLGFKTTGPGMSIRSSGSMLAPEGHEDLALDVS